MISKESVEATVELMLNGIRIIGLTAIVTVMAKGLKKGA